ncbi:MAG TPA: hypothetical protein DCY07_04235 [Rhodospirillaceae bacterium]|nr:hypothetical protein [Rhodospirillaceae bacterium]
MLRKPIISASYKGATAITSPVVKWGRRGAVALSLFTVLTGITGCAGQWVDMGGGCEGFVPDGTDMAVIGRCGADSQNPEAVEQRNEASRHLGRKAVQGLGGHFRIRH